MHYFPLLQRKKLCPIKFKFRLMCRNRQTDFKLKYVGSSVKTSITTTNEVPSLLTYTFCPPPPPKFVVVPIFSYIASFITKKQCDNSAVTHHTTNLDSLKHVTAIRHCSSNTCHVQQIFLHNMRFEILAAMKMLMLVFWETTPRGLVGRYKRFGGTYCLLYQGRILLHN
jgi:hypothetical protein